MLSEPDNDARPRNYPSHARLRRVRFLNLRNQAWREQWCLVWKPRQLNIENDAALRQREQNA